MMKKVLLALFMFSLLGLVLNCGTYNPENTQIQREWMLISFKNYSKNNLIASKAAVNLTAKSDRGNIEGTTFLGCNKIRFKVKIKDNQKLKISNITSFKMLCQNNQLENDFLKDFNQIVQYSVKGHFLTLKNKKGEEMKFIAADWD